MTLLFILLIIKNYNLMIFFPASFGTNLIISFKFIFSYGSFFLSTPRKYLNTALLIT
jgi:hypothetical protein